jgi:shikimate kinase
MRLGADASLADQWQRNSCGSAPKRVCKTHRARHISTGMHSTGNAMRPCSRLSSVRLIRSPNMKRVLLTGMSGTGKSSVVRELVARGYKAVDTDDGWSELQPDGRQLWREDAIQALLAAEDADVLFVAGCEENQGKFYAQFDCIVLLSAPLEILVERLATRFNNPYGKLRDEFHRFLDDVNTVEPRLRAIATFEVRTTAPLNEVVTVILHVVDA